MAQRGEWGSNVGFILAAVGGAVGLGNLWGFAHSASKGGGAAFLILYLGFVLLIGMPVLTVELVLGRRTGQSPVGALAAVARSWRWLGWLFVLVGVGILSFYSVLMGWTGRVLLDFVRGAIPADTGAYFGEISEGPGAIAAHLISLALAVAVIRGGVRAGIERASLILMPLLFALLIGLAVWAATLSGAGAGYAFYLKPDVSQLFHTSTITGAAGQAFFSLSLGMGAMITYASYLKGSDSLPRQAGTIALSDTGVAFVGGLVTFPILYHFGLQDQVSDSTIGVLFIAVPRGFLSMGGGGQLLGIVFFFALYIAALTSLISILEVVTSAVIDTFGRDRSTAALQVGALTAVTGIPGALSSDWVGFLFQLFGEVLLVFGGLMLALLVGYFWTADARDELRKGFGNEAAAAAWVWLLRTLVPLILAVTLYFSILKLIPAAQAILG